MTDLSEDDALAAEYVIGTLTAEERSTAEVRRERDAGFARLVDAWQTRLEPLIESVPSLEPDRRLREIILARIDAGRSRVANDNIAALRREIWIWRSAAVLALAAAVLLVIWGPGLRWAAPPPNTYVAVLQQGGAAPAFLVSLDLDKRIMTVMPSATSAEPDKSLQLWMVADPSVPQSLGLLDTGSPMKTTVPNMPAGMIANATYAVTVEPKGGSPKPTSTPIYVGHLMAEPH